MVCDERAKEKTSLSMKEKEKRVLMYRGERADSTLLEADHALQSPSSFAIAMQLVSPGQEQCNTMCSATQYNAIQGAVQNNAVPTLQ